MGCGARGKKIEMNRRSHKHSEEWNTGGWGNVGTGIKVSASTLRALLTYWLWDRVGFWVALHGVT